MNIEEMLALFDKEQRRQVEFIGFEREVTPDVVRLVDRQAERGETLAPVPFDHT